jgi:outer membrane protein assembly complex protein YaeT
MDCLFSAWRTIGRLLVIALIFPVISNAQTQPTTAPALNSSAVAPLAGRTVEGVRVLGNQTVSTAIILNLVRTREGSKFDPATVEEDYQRIYGLRKFANVEAKVEPTATGGVIVAFIVTENQQIKSIVFRGNTSVANSELSPIVETSIKVGEANDRFRISLAKQAIEAFYRDRNYPFAHVDVDAQQLVNGNLIFIITEGPNVRIRKVKFIGNRSFTDDRLKGQIQSKSWIWIFRRGNYDPDTVEDDVAALRRFYESKGFFDVRIGRKLVWSPDNSELQINFAIDEGQRYYVDKLIFRGNNSLSDSQLRANLKLTEGRPYDYDILQRDVREVIRAYSPFGFIYQANSTDPTYLQIGDPRDPPEDRIKKVFHAESGKVDLIYDISEGKPYHVGRVLVRENSKTQDKVVLRELRVVPGQLYNSGELQDAEERLRATPYFTNVKITPVDNGDPNTRDIVVEGNDREARTAQFNIGAGVNSNGGLGGQITYEQRNFDITNIPSRFQDIFTGQAFVGAGQTFRISLEPGTQQTNASIRFTEPWIFDQPYSFTGELYLRNRVREDYDDKRLGARASLGKRFNYIWSALVTVRGEQVDIDSVHDRPVRAQEILDAEGTSTITSLGLQVRRDTTNRGLLPSRGTTTTAGIEQAGALGGDYDFTRFTLSWDGYKTLKEDLLDRRTVLSVHGDFGYIPNDAPFFERFYGGGIGSVRGFAFRGISPRSGPEDDRVGGNFSITGSMEVSYPIAGDTLRGVVFTDAGDVEPDFQIGTIRWSVGAGIRLVLPILGQVPIAIDFAVPISKNSQDDTQFISFSLGFTQ